MDNAMSVFTYISLSLALFSFYYHIKSPQRRAWPKRTVTWLSLSVLLVEATYSVGAFVGYAQLRKHDDGGTWHRVCMIQGSLFNWSAITMVLLLFWFHYTQFKMLCRQIPSATLQRKEKPVIILIIIISTVLTLCPLLTNHVNARPNFYGCWIDDGLFYWLFYLLLLVVLITANYWCYQSVQWLSKVAESLVGGDRPEALRSLNRYKMSNLAIIIGTVYIFTTIFLDVLKYLLDFSLGPYFCFLISFDVLLFPLIFIAFSHGFSCMEVCYCCFNQSNSAPGTPQSSKSSSHHGGGNRLDSQSREGVDSIFEPFLESSISSRWTEDNGVSGMSQDEQSGQGEAGDYFEFEEEGHHHSRHHDGSLSANIIPPVFEDEDD